MLPGKKKRQTSSGLFLVFPEKNKPGNRERKRWANEKSQSKNASIKVCLKKIQIIAITKRT